MVHKLQIGYTPLRNIANIHACLLLFVRLSSNKCGYIKKDRQRLITGGSPVIKCYYPLSWQHCLKIVRIQFQAWNPVTDLASSRIAMMVRDSGLPSSKPPVYYLMV